MLTIIPKDVLATLGNIHKLLDIGQNFTKQNKTNSNNAAAMANNSNSEDKTNEGEKE
jgi:hypothetical protein